MSQQLVISENVFLLDILRSRHREVVGGRHLALSVRSEDPETGAIRNERHREIRWMHDVARSIVSENGMKLILARRRKAAVAALLETDEFFIAEIPAPGTLIDVPADGSGVSDLRRPDFSRSAGKRRVRSRDLLVFHQVD